MSEKNYKELYEKIKSQRDKATAKWQERNQDHLQRYRHEYYIKKQLHIEWLRVRGVISQEIDKQGGNPCKN